MESIQLMEQEASGREFIMQFAILELEVVVLELKVKEERKEKENEKEAPPLTVCHSIPDPDAKSSANFIEWKMCSSLGTEGEEEEAFDSDA